ncbi:alpha-L-fucosidase 2-like isoform X2 [Phragmites australis]|uniref:alpha-L-fucosidase 2-like isoform X2 n=1 Tax=Phragmites australis TaxID=29695 RepID=UPI002D7822DB|nr:alpha-L-fucosidase 2-like isoform X2 [Phragmites australis]
MDIDGDGDCDAGAEWVWVRRPSEAEVFAAAGGWVSAADEEARPLKVVFASPARYFTDAAPIGNGRLGAMVWGGVDSERLQLNRGPGNYTNPKAPAVLSKVRNLVDNGQYAKATDVAFGLSGDQTQVYQPLGDIDLAFGEHIKYTNYKRELDLHTATVNVTYTVGEVVYSRKHFSSNPHQVIATEISANKPGNVSFTVSLATPLDHQIHVTDANEIIMEGSCPGERPHEDYNASDHPIGIKFCAILYLQMSGANATVQVLNDKMLKLHGADSAVLLLAGATSFEGPFVKPSESKLDPRASAFTALNMARSISYSQLKAYHIDDYQSLFHRVSLQLSQGSNSSQDTTVSDCAVQTVNCSRSTDLNDSVKPTVDRIITFKDNEDPSLVELLFQFGRYLLISCSRPGTQISNLQGIWSNDTSPPWDAAPHPNINLQMNYWPALPCNLSECQEPLFDFIGSLSVNGAKTAKVNFEASGWVSHQVTDLWAKTSPDAGDPVWALWPMGGPWLATHLWEHYSFTMDRQFLEKTAYPLLEGSASFLLDWLIEGHGAYLETNPSTSPEHYFIAPDGKKACVSYSTTMDMSIIREVFSAVLLSADILGKSDTDVVQRIKKALPSLPPIKIARDGSIMEWAQDFEDAEVHHRHVSHLFGLYPGHTMSLDQTPDLCKAVANSLYKRGDEGPGWSTSWKMALWAHLHNSEHAYKMILQLITLVDPKHEVSKEGGLYSNLFTAHPPFQIDANFGFPAALSEMLVQSTGNDLYLLPSLPRNKWPHGCVKGLKARGGVTVNICWKEGSLHEALLWSSSDQNSLARLHYGDQTTTISLSPGQVYRFSRDLKCFKAWSL